jgi:hypothetical protein
MMISRMKRQELEEQECPNWLLDRHENLHERTKEEDAEGNLQLEKAESELEKHQDEENIERTTKYV